MLKHIPLIFALFFFSLCLTAAESATSPWEGPLYKENNEEQAGWARPFLEKIILKGDEHILDLGCGDGKNTNILFSRVPQGKVIGSDKSSSMINAAQKLAQERLSFLVQDMTKPGFEAESFDIVVSTTALHWVEDQDAVVKNTHRYLRPGGKLYFLIPTRWDLFFQLKDTFHAIRMSGKYENYLKNAKPQVFVHTPDQYTDRLISHGFRLNSLLLKPKENIFSSRDSFVAWASAWIFAEFNTIPDGMRKEFLQDFVNTYVSQKDATDSDGKIHYYGYLMEIEATKL